MQREDLTGMKTGCQVLDALVGMDGDVDFSSSLLSFIFMSSPLSSAIYSLPFLLSFYFALLVVVSRSVNLQPSSKSCNGHGGQQR